MFPVGHSKSPQHMSDPEFWLDRTMRLSGVFGAGRWHLENSYEIMNSGILLPDKIVR